MPACVVVLCAVDSRSIRQLSVPAQAACACACGQAGDAAHATPPLPSPASLSLVAVRLTTYPDQVRVLHQATT